MDKPAVAVRAEYGAVRGVSSKDFKEERVMLKNVEFELVKPLRDAIRSSPAFVEADEEEDVLSPTTTLGRRPSMVVSRMSYDDDSDGGDDGETPRRLVQQPPSDSTPSSLGQYSPPTQMSLDELSIENHRAKELRWLRALGASSSSSALKKNKKIRTLVHAGIPSSVRGRVWSYLADVNDVKVEGSYQVS